MAYVRLAPLALFLLATSLMFSTKRINAEVCPAGPCSPLDILPCGSPKCSCVPHPFLHSSEVASFAKMVDKHLSLCQSHDECMKKGSGNFCARYSNPRMAYGLCINSEVLKAS
ncbi:hypothetical protein CR513_20165, partial [Mucuna pruriens]